MSIKKLPIYKTFLDIQDKFWDLKILEPYAVFE